MRYFPMFVRMADRRVVIAGGGEQAAQKLRLLLKTEAALTLMAPALEPEPAAAVAAGRAAHVAEVCAPQALRGAQMLVCCTGCVGADACIADLGRVAGALVNVVDRPELCEAITPALVDRDPLVVAIGTEGAAPVLARGVKTAMERMLDPTIGGLVAFAAELREEAARRLTPERRRGFWEWFFNGALAARWRRGDREGVAAAAAQALAAGGPPPAPGAVALVGAGPGAADLITLRGVQRLQEADVIFYDRLLDPGVLDLARRDAERVYVGKGAAEAGAPLQAEIDAQLVAAARAGKRVVRLKTGDPGVFGRAASELAALSAAGFDVEVVPGVTAASAAAAELGAPLTDAAAAQHVILTSAQPAPDAAPVDWPALAATGATLAIYMGVRKAPEIRAALLAAGVRPETPAAVVERAGAPDARRAQTTLAQLPDAIADAGLTNPALLLIAPNRA